MKIKIRKRTFPKDLEDEAEETRDDLTGTMLALIDEVSVTGGDLEAVVRLDTNVENEAEVALHVVVGEMKDLLLTGSEVMKMIAIVDIDMYILLEEKKRGERLIILTGMIMDIQEDMEKIVTMDKDSVGRQNILLGEMKTGGEPRILTSGVIMDTRGEMMIGILDSGAAGIVDSLLGEITTRPGHLIAMTGEIIMDIQVAETTEGILTKEETRL